MQSLRQSLDGPCLIAGCAGDVRFSRGLCCLHYFRWRRFGDARAPALKFKPSSRRGERKVAPCR